MKILIALLLVISASSTFAEEGKFVNYVITCNDSKEITVAFLKSSELASTNYSKLSSVWKDRAWATSLESQHSHSQEQCIIRPQAKSFRSAMIKYAF